jgi:hypothetical protein
MRSRLALLAFCAILACFTALPATAATARRTTAEFDLQGSNSYTVFFRFSGREASIEAIDIPSPLVLVSAAYISKGSFKGGHIRARFGNRGRVAVEFKPSGKATYRRPPRRCEGEPRVTQPGVFVGTIRFRGENGYTNIDRSRARGEVRTPARWECRRGKRARKAGLDPEAEKLTVLTAGANHGFTSFNTTASRPRGRSGETMFTASQLEGRPTSMVVIRRAFAHGEDESFTFDEALSTATAAPPPPFDGSAAFTRDPGGGSWLGPLTVDFPGAADVPLAGEEFTARLYREDESEILELLAGALS